jgi:hypothetical protein
MSDASSQGERLPRSPTVLQGARTEKAAPGSGLSVSIDGTAVQRVRSMKADCIGFTVAPSHRVVLSATSRQCVVAVS